MALFSRQVEFLVTGPLPCCMHLDLALFPPGQRTRPNYFEPIEGAFLLPRCALTPRASSGSHVVLPSCPVSKTTRLSSMIDHRVLLSRESRCWESTAWNYCCTSGFLHHQSVQSSPVGRERSTYEEFLDTRDRFPGSKHPSFLALSATQGQRARA